MTNARHTVNTNTNASSGRSDHPIQVSPKHALMFFRDGEGRIHPVLKPEALAAASATSTGTGQPEPESKSQAKALPSKVKVHRDEGKLHLTESDESTSSSSPSWGGAGSGLSKLTDTAESDLATYIRRLLAKGHKMADIVQALMKDPSIDGPGLVKAIRHLAKP